MNAAAAASGIAAGAVVGAVHIVADATTGSQLISVLGIVVPSVTTLGVALIYRWGRSGEIDRPPAPVSPPRRARRRELPADRDELVRLRERIDAQLDDEESP